VVHQFSLSPLPRNPYSSPGPPPLSQKEASPHEAFSTNAAKWTLFPGSPLSLFFSFTLSERLAFSPPFMLVDVFLRMGKYLLSLGKADFPLFPLEERPPCPQAVSWAFLNRVVGVLSPRSPNIFTPLCSVSHSLSSLSFFFCVERRALALRSESFFSIFPGGLGHLPPPLRGSMQTSLQPFSGAADLLLSWSG